MKNQINRFVFALLFIFITDFSYAQHLHKEKEYQTYWCSKNNGTTETVLDDRSKVDCVLEDYAVEFDFAKKWAEAVGQALYYSLKTGKKPGIVLILEGPEDEKHLVKLEKLAKEYGIKVWVMRPQDLNN